MTAQRKDISDPDVILEFAKIVGDKLHLDYLYAMTVADIRATNPEMWNSWRATLMRQLYQNTARVLRQGLENPVNRAERIADKKESASGKLAELNIPADIIAKIWSKVSDEYFVRESASNIAWHTEVVAEFDGEGALVSIRDISENSAEGATQIFIYTSNSNYLFANCTAVFEKLNLNIQGARIFTSADDHCMDTFTVLESNGQRVGDNSKRIEEIKSSLIRQLAVGGQPSSPANIRLTRKDKYFSNRIETAVINSTNKDYTTLEINCPDQPGILASIGKVFAEKDIILKDARITTLGERVEDLFFITDQDGALLEDSDRADELQEAIHSELESRLST
jgi:[protein-PII] uridylyltransferase